MVRFIVEGGRPLSGEIAVSGAKNAALPILAACLLCPGPVELTNCPKLRDVDNMLRILASLGASYAWQGDVLTVNTSTANGCVMPQELAKELRSSIFMLGPLLARFGSAVCSYPGGCEIGHRPIDLHIRGLSMLGVRIEEEHGLIYCSGEDLRGAEIHLDYPSVGATENIIMAAVRAEGETVVQNAAREPEIEDLQRLLRAAGYRVYGAGTSTVTVIGGREQTGNDRVRHRVIPDRIVAGTLLTAAAITGGSVTLTETEPEHVSSILSKLREAGCRLDTCGDRICLAAPKRPREIKLIETLPYPGFPTDMQAQMFVLACVADGATVIVENVFENRFKHAAELARMGAVYTQKDRMVIVRGVSTLTGAEVTARDLRGGAALTLAGLAAAGKTTVRNAELIDRGYEGLDCMLRQLGAHITREED